MSYILKTLDNKTLTLCEKHKNIFGIPYKLVGISTDACQYDIPRLVLIVIFRGDRNMYGEQQSFIKTICEECFDGFTSASGYTIRQARPAPLGYKCNLCHYVQI